MAKIVATLVRQQSSASMNPRSVTFTPAFSRLQAVGDRFAADGAQEQVGLEHFVAEVAGHAFVVGGNLLERLAGEDADAEALLHVAAHFAPHIGIEQQQNVFEQLDDRHLHAEHRRHAGQFAADESAAEHQHALGQPGEVEEAAALHHALVFRQEAGHDRGGTGGDDDLLGAEGLGLGSRARRRRSLRW